MKRRILVFLPMIFAFFLVLNAQRSARGEAGFVGAETCKGCHEEIYNKFVKTVHGKKAVPGNPINRDGCESCHGPGSQHAEKGGGKGVAIFVFGKKVDAKDKTSKCLACHSETREVAFWDNGRHKSAQVSCDNCHSIHAGGAKYLKAPQPLLCFTCHTEVKLKTGKQSHHPIREGKVGCSDCHNPHGTFMVQSSGIRGSSITRSLRADSINDLCYKCHAEKRGPYMWQHPPVEENCLNCHTPHGSNNQKLLNTKPPLLCQECHDASRHPGTIYPNQNTFLGSAPSNRLYARACLNCHSNIHGSNGPSVRGRVFVR